MYPRKMHAPLEIIYMIPAALLEYKLVHHPFHFGSRGATASQMIKDVMADVSRDDMVEECFEAVRQLRQLK